MKLCYGVRRGTFHPFPGEGMWTLPRGDTRTRYLRHVKGMGFDGMELGAEMFGGMDATEEQSKELQSILRDGGGAVRGHSHTGGR